MEKNAVIYSKDVYTDLEKILAVNTDSYRSDFYKYDNITITTDARKIKGGECVNLLWLTRRCGTCCVHELDACIKGTSQYGSWCGFKGSRYEHPLAFAVQLHGRDREKAVGSIYFIDYDECVDQINSICQTPIRVIVTYRCYTGDMFTETYDYGDYNANWYEYAKKYGRVMKVYYEISDSFLLTNQLYDIRRERAAKAVEIKIDDFVAALAKERLESYGYMTGDMVIANETEAEFAIKENIPVYALFKDGVKQVITENEQIQKHVMSGSLESNSMFGMKAADRDALYEKIGYKIRNLIG